MQLKEHYKKPHILELLRSKYIIDPDEEVFFTHDPENFVKPTDFETWTVEKMDVQEYGKQRFKELGINDSNNIIELTGGKNVRKNERVPQEIFSINRFGDIEILQYSLKREAYTDGEKKERYVYQTRLHPWKEKIYDGKYDFSFAKNAPFWSPELIELYESETETDYLVITEGQFKARKACLEGIPTVGLTSISHFKKSGKIHGEIIEFIQRCKVKKLIVLWDGDCRDISLKSLDEREDISKRPKLFYNFAIKIKDLVHDIISPKKLHIYFATINSADIHNNPKGIDDLLTSIDPAVVVDEFDQIGAVPTQILEWFSIQNETAQKKLRKWFKLHYVNEFYEFHREKIREFDFVFFGSTYRVEKGLPIVQVSSKVKEYKRIGPDYFRLINNGVYDENGELVRKEPSLVPWKTGEIARDHGKEVFDHIERLDGFTNVANHTNYQQIVGNMWNLYNDVNHEIIPGEWSNIESLLHHIFQDQYEMALDYLQLLYTKPYQKLPVLCLVSKDEGTGKSTFIQLLQMIFQNNMALVSSEDIMGNWTSHWVSKLLVASEETLFEKKEALEKIKNLSTADWVMRSERFVNNSMIQCFLKFVFCSNHEDDFIKLNKNSSRFWVIKVKPVTGEKKTNLKNLMQEEIKHFLHFLTNRELVNPKRDRMWFSLDQIITDAWRNVVSHSEPGPIKELRLKLQDYFLKWNDDKVEMTAENIRNVFGIRQEASYLNKVIREYLKVDRKRNAKGDEVVTTYKYKKEDASDATKFVEVSDKGRPYVFFKQDFVPSDIQTVMEFQNNPNNYMAEWKTKEDLPF